MNTRRILSCLISFVFITPLLYAQSDSNYVSIQVSTGISASFSTYNTGYLNTISGEEIFIAGGGLGAHNLSIGYGFRKNFEVLASAGFIADGPDLNNGFISYFITVFQTTLKYNFLENDRHHLYIGGGLTLYAKPSLEIDGSQIQGGDQTKYFYKSSVSPVICISYHYKLSKRLDFLFDVNSSCNNLNLRSAELDFTDIDIQNLSAEKLAAFSKINATNIIFQVGLALNL